MTDSNKCWWGCGATWTRILHWREYKVIELLGKTIFGKLHIDFPCDPALLLLGICSKNKSSKIYTKMLIAVLLYKSSKLEKNTNVHQKENGHPEVQVGDGTLPHSKRNNYWIHSMDESCKHKHGHEVGFHLYELLEQAKLIIERSVCTLGYLHGVLLHGIRNCQNHPTETWHFIACTTVFNCSV